METSPPYVLRRSRIKDILYILYYFGACGFIVALFYVLTLPIAHGQQPHWLLAITIKILVVLLAFRSFWMVLGALVIIFVYVPYLIFPNRDEIILEKDQIIFRSKRGEFKYLWSEIEEFEPCAWRIMMGMPVFESSVPWYWRIIGVLFVFFMAVQFEVVSGDRVISKRIFQNEEEEDEADDYGEADMVIENIAGFNANELAAILNHWRNQALAATV